MTGVMSDSIQEMRRSPEDQSGDQRDQTAGLNSTSGILAPVVRSEAPLDLYTAKRRNSVHWKRETTTWAALRAMASCPANKKECGNYIVATVRQTDRPQCKGQSTCTHWHRNRESIVARSVLTLDADSATPGFPKAVRRLGCAAIVHSTFSSTPEAPRYRVLILLDRDVKPSEYRRLAAVVMHEVGIRSFDPGSIQPERYMYRPASTSPDIYEHHDIEGDPLAVDEWLARFDEARHVVLTEENPGAANRDPYQIAGIVGAFNRVYSIADAVETFGLPYEHDGGNRWHLEGAKSEAGMVEIADGLVFSHHANDPVNNGHARTAFDLVRIHRFGHEDEGADPATPVGQLPSHKAFVRLLAVDRKVLAELDASAAEDFMEPEPEPEPEPVDPVTLAEAEAVFRRWLGPSYDMDSMRMVAAAAAVERMSGLPLWLMVLSGSGNAKTATVDSLVGVPRVRTISTIQSTGALLSATPAKERARGATGGLLREMGSRGLLVVKDFTSILQANSNTRNEVIAAFREMYDGRWERNVGTDGGRKLEWEGRISFVGAVTSAWDNHYSAISTMGDRFVLLRVDSADPKGRLESGQQALDNDNHEEEMRADLAAAMAGLVAGIDPGPHSLTKGEEHRLLFAADLVTRARTSVQTDYKGDPMNADQPEAPQRFAKQLSQVVRGGLAIGMSRAEAMRLGIRAARDSVPPLRLAILEDLEQNPLSTTQDVRKRLNMPRTTVDRQLQSLHMLQLLVVGEIERGGYGGITWIYQLAEGVTPSVLDLDAQYALDDLI